jgi:hypothetical protein
MWAAIALAVDGCPVFAGEHGAFCMLPSRPLLDERGHHQRGADGRLAYEPIVRWTTRQRSDEFSAAVVALIVHKYGPEALVTMPSLPPRRTRQTAPARQLPLALGPPS